MCTYSTRALVVTCIALRLLLYLYLVKSVCFCVCLVGPTTTDHHIVQGNLLQLLQPRQEHLLLGDHLHLVHSQREGSGESEGDGGTYNYCPPREVGESVERVQCHFCSCDDRGESGAWYLAVREGAGGGERWYCKRRARTSVITTEHQGTCSGKHPLLALWRLSLLYMCVRCTLIRPFTQRDN